MMAAEWQLLIFEGASAGQHGAAGAVWVDLPWANPTGRAELERASNATTSSVGRHDAACEAALTAAATAFRNGLYANKSAFPQGRRWKHPSSCL